MGEGSGRVTPHGGAAGLHGPTLTSERIVGPTKLPFSYPGTFTSRPSSSNFRGWGRRGGGGESGVICFASVTVLQQYLGSFVNATLHKTAHTLLGFWGDEGPQVSTWLVSSIDLHRKGQNQE